MHAIRTRLSARAAVLCVFGAPLAHYARAQLDPSDPFLKDAAVGFNALTFYMNQEDNSKPPDSTVKEAWALGGKLYARSGYWRETLQLGASYYFSVPLYAPDDKDGTNLLGPGQSTISVLGELYARLKFQNHTLTLGRQEIDMSYKRPSGVRSNRGDITYVARFDNRMVPVTYEAALLGGQFDDSLNYYVGLVNKDKVGNSEDFSHVGQAIGASGSDADMWMGGVQFAPMKDFWLQGWYHHVSDVIGIGFLDADYVLRLSEKSYLRLAGQYTDQRSVGANALTGSSFSTSQAGAYGEYGFEFVTLYGVYEKTGSGADIRFPFSTGPNYTQQETRTFSRAHESAWQLGIGTDLGRAASGLSSYFDVTSGKGAINPSTGASLADEIEYDLGVVWMLKQKGSFFDGFRARFRYGWVTDQTSAGDKQSTDLRIDVNLPISFL
jgi:hypothetical protein